MARGYFGNILDSFEFETSDLLSIDDRNYRPAGAMGDGQLLIDVTESEVGPVVHFTHEQLVELAMLGVLRYQREHFKIARRRRRKA